MYEIQKTTNYRFQYTKLNLRFKRFVDEAIEVLKENPTDYQNRITHIGNKKDGGLYRFRIPGCYLMYVVPFHQENEAQSIILLSVKMM
ncbi:MAG: hypothetical protein K0Q50_1401 [Vampirovibrio sp.]|jgi:mRNA-degrading endonuclease RelE of RelBE toxin-antitoxin system|nr:hypothetical protein [Vampirovibrio sp.]